MKYKAVLFDMDGVILDSEPLHVAAFRATIADYGHDLSDDDYKSHFAGKTDKAGFESYFKFINEAVDLPVIMDKKAQKYMSLATDQLVPYPGVTAVIKEVSAMVPIALVTGSLRAEAEIALNSLGIHENFQTIVAAEDVSHGKPAPEGYLLAAQRLGIPIHECVVVEDSISGITAGKAAGAEVIAVTNTHSAQELKDAQKIVDQLTIHAFES